MFLKGSKLISSNQSTELKNK